MRCFYIHRVYIKPALHLFSNCENVIATCIFECEYSLTRGLYRRIMTGFYNRIMMEEPTVVMKLGSPIFILKIITALHCHLKWYKVNLLENEQSFVCQGKVQLGIDYLSLTLTHAQCSKKSCPRQITKRTIVLAGGSCCIEQPADFSVVALCSAGCLWNPWRGLILKTWIIKVVMMTEWWLLCINKWRHWMHDSLTI